MLGLCQFTTSSNGQVAAYSCASVFAPPHPAEKTKKTTMAAIISGFRPKISLSLARMTRKPARGNQSMLLHTYEIGTYRYM